MPSPPKPSVTPMIGPTPVGAQPIVLPTPIQPEPIVLPKPVPVPPTSPTSPAGGGTVTTSPTTPAGGGTVTTSPTAPAGGGTVTTSPTTPAGGGTVTTSPTTPTSGPLISLTTQNPVYPAKAGDQPQAAQVTVAWDPSFANLQSLTFGLTVTDDLGSTSTQKTVTVTIQQAPVANITTPNSVVAAGSSIPLDGSGSTGVDLSYKWQLTSTTPIPSSGTTLT